MECISGCIIFQDDVQPPKVQSRKDCHDELTSLPGKPLLGAHTAEVLHQVAGAGIPEGGWVGGDTWFGSVITVVETFLHLKVHSTFIVKNNQRMFSMQVLHVVLKAWFGARLAGHWVVLHATGAGVKLFTLVNA
jgi:hypothetical protein